MIASKYLYDEGEVDEVVNDAWAQSANIDIDEINQLERAFLSAIVSRLMLGVCTHLNAILNCIYFLFGFLKFELFFAFNFVTVFFSYNPSGIADCESQFTS